jgi:cytochrome c-type biogenesis protein CcmH/NrfF
MILGLFFILFGGLLLLKELGLITITVSLWALALPVLLLVIGVYIVLGALKTRKYRDMMIRKFSRKFVENDAREE